MKIKKLFLIAISLSLAAFFAACSTKSDELYNLSAKAWYEQIIKDIRDRDLEKADEHYSAMAGEHVADALLEPVQLILAQSHIDEEEYELAEFYLNENAKKFGNSQNLDFINFLKIKAKFDAFAQPYRDQGLMLESLDEIKKFKESYPVTEFSPLVDTMLTKFNLAVYVLDEEIAALYKRTGRDTSYEIYQQKLQNSEFKNIKADKPKVPWYRKVFE